MLIDVERNKTSKTRAIKYVSVYVKDHRDAGYVLELLRAYDCPKALMYNAAVDLMKTKQWTSFTVGGKRIMLSTAFARKESAEDLRDSFEHS